MGEKGLVIAFALATALFWGLYGPALGESRSKTAPPQWTPFKPYVFIGVAYLVWGVIGGIVGMRVIPQTPDNFSFTGIYLPAMKWGFIAGTLGAFGALTLTFAMIKAKGNAALVMPIVFGGAVSVTAITNLVILRLIRSSQEWPDPRLWVGIALVAVGIVLVAIYTPHGHGPAKDAAHPPAHASAQPPEGHLPASS